MDRQLRSNGRVPRQLVRDQHESPAPRPRRLQPRCGCRRSLVVPDLATSVPKPTNGGRRYTFHLKNGVKFGPPVNREITSQGREVRDRAAGTAEERRAVRLLLQRDPGAATRTARASRSRSRASRRRTRRRSCSTSRSPTGDFLLRLGMPAASRCPRRSRSASTASRALYGRDVIASGPYMIEGLGQPEHQLLQDDEADQRLRRHDEAHARPEPELQRRRPTAARHGRTTRTASSSPSTRTSTTSTTRSAAGELDDEYATASPKVFRDYSTNPSKRKYLHSNYADGVVLHHHEPDAAAVRRRARPQGDELGHGPERAPKAWGGAVSGGDRRRARSRRRCCSESSHNYYPFKTPGDTDSLAKAKAEMAKSKYATSNGVCTAKACKDVLLITDVRAVDKADRCRPFRRSREDRHHVHVAERQRRLPGYPDDVEEHPDLDSAAVVQGLRGPVDVHRSAVQRHQHHPER